MHKLWQELIPLYITRQLLPDQHYALENHLATCAECRRALDEWRQIASVVQSEAAAWSRELPPLAVLVREQLSQSSSAPSASAPTRDAPLSEPTRLSMFRKQPSRLPVTMIAAAVVMVLFAGLLLRAVISGGDESTTNQPPATSMVGLSPDDGTYQPFTPLPVTPTITPFGGQQSAPDSPVPPTPTQHTINTPQSATLVTASTGDCMISSDTGQNILIYQWPEYESPTTGMLPVGQAWRSVIVSGTGWYQLIWPEGGIAGWVSDSEVLAQGNCTLLSLPTPTSLADNGQCMAVAPTSTSIYNGPGYEHVILGTLVAGETRRVWITDGAGWYQILGEGSGIGGWVPSELVEFIGACDQIPLPTPTLIWTPSPVAPPTGCILQNPTGDILNIRLGPGESYDYINAFNEPLTVIARSDNDWFRIEHYFAGKYWVGWIPETLVVLSGECNSLPVLESDNYAPEPTPIHATPTIIIDGD